MLWFSVFTSLLAFFGSEVSECHSVVSDSLWPHGLNSPSQNTGVGSLSLLQGIFPTQGSNPGLLHCRWILYQLNHKGSPWGGGGLFSLWLQSSCLLKKTCWFSICSDLFLILRMTVPKLFTFWVEIGRFILVYIFFLLLRLNNLNWPIFKSSSSFFCLLKSFVEPLQWIFFFPLFSYFALVL